MTYKIIFRKEAAKELEDIYNYYFDKNPHTADKIYHSILEGIDRYLMHTPEIASMEHMLADETELFRSLVVFKGLFKIIFYTTDNYVVVTQIWCCRRNPQDIRRI